MSTKRRRGWFGEFSAGEEDRVVAECSHKFDLDFDADGDNDHEKYSAAIKKAISAVLYVLEKSNTTANLPDRVVAVREGDNFKVCISLFDGMDWDDEISRTVKKPRCILALAKPTPYISVLLPLSSL